MEKIIKKGVFIIYKKIIKLLVRGGRSVSTLPFVPISFRVKLLKMTGIQIQKGARILPGNIFLISQMSIGGNSFINRNCFFDDGGMGSSITIGDNVWLAPYVKVICISHEYTDSKIRSGERIVKPVIIRDGSWIGINSTILQGVTIGEGCVVAAGSVVTKDIPSNELWGGVPAKFIKKL